MRTEAEFEDLTVEERPESQDGVTLESENDAIDRGADARAEHDTRDTVADTRIDTLEQRVASLEADLDAVRGLLGGIEAVDEAVEQRASIALAKVEALERRVDEEDGLVRERLSDTRADERSRSTVATEQEAADAAEPESHQADEDRGSLTTRLRDAFQ